MSLLVQYIMTFIVIGAVVAWIVWRLIKKENRKDCGCGCGGCALSEKCGNVKAKSKESIKK